MRLKAVSVLLTLGVSLEAAAAAELEIVNSSSVAIQHLFLARKGQRKWGADRLDGQDAIAPGATRIVPGIDRDAYDLRLSDDADRECQIYSVAIARTHRLELTDATLDECTRESH
jgi:hypothetical protein